jgi:hypothetical protein
MVTHGDVCTALLGYTTASSPKAQDVMGGVAIGSLSTIQIANDQWTITEKGFVPEQR